MAGAGVALGACGSSSGGTGSSSPSSSVPTAPAFPLGAAAELLALAYVLGQDLDAGDLKITPEVTVGIAVTNKACPGLSPGQSTASSLARFNACGKNMDVWSSGGR